MAKSNKNSEKPSKANKEDKDRDLILEMIDKDREDIENKSESNVISLIKPGVDSNVVSASADTPSNDIDASYYANVKGVVSSAENNDSGTYTDDTSNSNTEEPEGLFIKNNHVSLNAKAKMLNNQINEEKLSASILNERVPGINENIVVLPELEQNMTPEEVEQHAKEELAEELQLTAKQLTTFSLKTFVFGLVALSCVAFITVAITKMKVPEEVVTVDYGQDYEKLQPELDAFVEKIDAIDSRNYTLTYQVNADQQTDANTAEYIFRGDDRNKSIYFTTVEDDNGWLVDSYRIKIGNGVYKEYAKSYQMVDSDKYFLNINPMLSLLGYVTDLDYELPNYIVMDSKDTMLEFSEDMCGIYKSNEDIRVSKPTEPYYTLFTKYEEDINNMAVPLSNPNDSEEASEESSEEDSNSEVVEEFDETNSSSVDYVIKYTNEDNYGKTRVIEENSEPSLDSKDWKIQLPCNAKDMSKSFYDAVMKFVREEMNDIYAISDCDVTYCVDGERYLDFMNYITQYTNSDCEYFLTPEIMTTDMSMKLNINYYDVLNKIVTIRMKLTNTLTSESYIFECVHSNKTIVNNPGLSITSNYVMSEADWSEIRNLAAQSNYNLYYDEVISEHSNLVKKYNEDYENYKRIAEYNNEPVVTDDRGVILENLVEEEPTEEDEEINYTLDSYGNRVYDNLDEALEGLREQALNGEGGDYKVYYKHLN